MLINVNRLNVNAARVGARDGARKARTLRRGNIHVLHLLIRRTPPLCPQAVFLLFSFAQLSTVYFYCTVLCRNPRAMSTANSMPSSLRKTFNICTIITVKSSSFREFLRYEYCTFVVSQYNSCLINIQVSICLSFKISHSVSHAFFNFMSFETVYI